MTAASFAAPPDFARSFDGTMVATRRVGGGHGTPLLVCNPPGASLAVWRDALAPMLAERPLVSWDLRGLFESSPPVSARIDAGAHAEDALAALDRYDIERCAVAAWSSAGRIALEIASRYPERVSALALVCGGYGHSPSRFFQFFELFSLVPMAAAVAKHFSAPLQGALRTFVARPEIAGLIRQSGLVAATADTASLVELLGGLAECDLKMLLSISETVIGDSAPHLLRSLEAPTLLIAGEKDLFTTRRMVDEMARMIPDARLVVYDKATHYLPIEYPARLALDLRSFLGEQDAGV